jgi:hypothetical protein
MGTFRNACSVGFDSLENFKISEGLVELAHGSVWEGECQQCAPDYVRGDRASESAYPCFRLGGQGIVRCVAQLLTAIYEASTKLEAVPKRYEAQ